MRTSCSLFGLHELSNTYLALRQGLDMFPLILWSRETRDALQTFPSAYQLLPVGTTSFQDYSNKRINIYKDKSWLNDRTYRHHVDNAADFHLELRQARARVQRTGMAVPIVDIFGFGQLTVTQISTPPYPDLTRWENASPVKRVFGDGRVPEGSATVVGHRSYPVNQTHDAVFRGRHAEGVLRHDLCRGMALRYPHKSGQRYVISAEVVGAFHSPGARADVRIDLHDVDGRNVEEATFRLVVTDEQGKEQPEVYLGGSNGANIIVPETVGGVRARSLLDLSRRRGYGTHLRLLCRS